MKKIITITDKGLATLKEAIAKTKRPVQKFQQKRSPRIFGGDSSNAYAKEAIIIEVVANVYTCKLRKWEGGVWKTYGDNISVAPMKKIGSNSLAGSVWPQFVAGEVLLVFQRANGIWWTPVVVDDFNECPNP